MAKSYVLNLCIAALLIQFVVGQDFFSIELDGKFTHHDGPYITEILTTGKYNISETRRLKRGEPLIAPLVFTGKLTFRSAQEVIVFGVNSSFQLTHMNVDENEDVNTNRVKREAARPKFKLEFFGQFAFGEPGHQEILGVRLNIDANQLSEEYRRATSDEVMAKVKPKIEFAFIGNITGTNHWGEKFGAIFDISLGFQGSRTSNPDFEANMETDREKRETGQSIIPTFNIDGQFIVDEQWRKNKGGLRYQWRSFY